MSIKMIPYRALNLAEDELREKAKSFFELMSQRRSVRDFSDRDVPREMIEYAIQTAATAPSGANRQPWHFVAINDSILKNGIREAAEKEEREFYEGSRRNEDWLHALEPIGTSWRKPFLETAPWLVVIFAERYGVDDDGSKIKNYYVQESVGIACGLFISALHQMGLVTLTHTPSPMGFLSRLLERPENEKAYILFPVGYPAANACVPDIHKKQLDEVCSWKVSKDSTGS